jgi:hypothetical protein
MKNTPLARQQDLVIQTSGSETLVYDLKANKAFCLNETSALIWNLCDGNNSVEEIKAGIKDVSGVENNEDLIFLGLDLLNKNGLLEKGFVPSDKLSGLSRREVIKRVGFASAIALPLVTSIVAPKAVSAQSGGMVLDLCTGAGGQGSCNPGLFCTPTTTTVNTGVTVSTPTGNNQCCTGNTGTISGTFCGICGVSIACDGTPSQLDPTGPFCTTGGSPCIFP